METVTFHLVSHPNTHQLSPYLLLLILHDEVTEDYTVLIIMHNKFGH